MLIGSDNRDAAFSAKTYIFEYHNVIMYRTANNSQTIWQCDLCVR